MSGARTLAGFASAYNLTPSATQASRGPVPQFVMYATGPADRWDLIAWRAYGDPTLIAPIIAANSTVAISPVLDQGATIYCPLQSPPSAASNSLPWLP